MSDRVYTTSEISEAIVSVYNAALMTHAEGVTSHDECLGSKSAIVAILTMLEIEYRIEPADGRTPSAVLEHVDEPDLGPKPLDEGPAT